MMLRPAIALLSPGGSRARLSVLMFHRVLGQPDPLFLDVPDTQRFDDILDWVGRWFRVLPLDEAVDRMRSATLPARAAAITFDDGYADNATHAVPLLQRHGMVATFFVVTDFLEGGCMWNDRIIESVRACRHDALDLRSAGFERFGLCSLDERRRAVGALIGHIKYLEPGLRDRTVAAIEAAAGAGACAPLMMDTQQVRQLRRAGMQIGAHTCSHPILAKTADDEARGEIVGSKRVLESLLQEPVSLFAYPNGKPGRDYLEQHVDMVRAAGFAAAFTTAAGVSSSTSDRLQLPRFSPWDRTRSRYGLQLLRNLFARKSAATA